jgi:hypothetical protein
MGSNDEPSQHFSGTNQHFSGTKMCSTRGSHAGASGIAAGDMDRHLLACELLAVGDCGLGGGTRLSGLVHSMAGYRVHCLEEQDGL